MKNNLKKKIPIYNNKFKPNDFFFFKCCFEVLQISSSFS